MVRDREAVRNSKTHNMIKERERGQREKERESERERWIFHWKNSFETHVWFNFAGDCSLKRF